MLKKSSLLHRRVSKQFILLAKFENITNTSFAFSAVKRPLIAIGKVLSNHLRLTVMNLFFFRSSSLVVNLLVIYISLFFNCTKIKSQIVYTHADSLKGSISAERLWWDLAHYDLSVSFNPAENSIKGSNKILYRVLQNYQVIQLDLIWPMQLDSVTEDGKQCEWRQDGNAYFITLNLKQVVGATNQISAFFHGQPHAAKLPPWDGGVIWAKDQKGIPWISIACQGMSAGVWFPNKDHQYDEVDSASMFFTAPKNLVTVSNGRLRSKKINADSTATYNWVVKNPINNYNIIPYIGKYVNFKDTIRGLGGILDLDFWVLEENLPKAIQHFKQSKTMLHCFEDWFGKYPFYEDGYKLVEAPFLGMEHQSAIAYGNKFEYGYRGKDLSLTGWGLKWDFIIVHESGHEWFGNNITAKDVADNWIHEGFTAYSENLYVECLFGKKAGAEYVIGTRFAIKNDKPIIGDYNVNRDGSGDMYYKAANMLHGIRQIVNNDSLWKATLRGLNTTFWHQTVTTKQIENYLISALKLDLQKIFDQYLRSTNIPTLEYKLKKKKVTFRWTNCVSGFNMPLQIETKQGIRQIKPTMLWQTVVLNEATFTPLPDFYIKTKNSR
jgi:aminopeptidase N